MKFEVPILYRGQCSYVVDAATPEMAKQRAKNRLPSEWTALPWKEIAKEINRVCPIGIVGRGPTAEQKHFMEKPIL